MAFLPFRERARIVLFRWPAIIAGLFVALGIHIVLTAFGLGVVFLQTQSAESGGSMAAAGLLLWSGLAWITAAFIARKHSAAPTIDSNGRKDAVAICWDVLRTSTTVITERSAVPFTT